MTLNGHFVLCFKMRACSEPTTKISMKIDPYYQRQRCSAMTLVSGNIRFMRIFAEVPCRRGVKRQCCNRKCRFSGLSDTTSRHLRKWGQRYYIVLFSSLSPFNFYYYYWFSTEKSDITPIPPEFWGSSPWTRLSMSWLRGAKTLS